MGNPNKVPLILGTPHVGQSLKKGRTSRIQVDTSASSPPLVDRIWLLGILGLYRVYIGIMEKNMETTI